MSKLTTTVAVALAAVWLFIGGVHGTSGGAPIMACETMVPMHPGQTAQVGNGVFEVTTNVPATYELSTDYTVTVRSTDQSSNFNGLFCQARDSGSGSVSPGLGMFATSPRLKLLNCVGGAGLEGTNSAAAITHDTPLNTNSMTFTWTSPPVPTADLSMRCSVVVSFSTFHVQIPSAEFLAPAAIDNVTAPPAETLATMAPVTALPTNLLSDCQATPPTAFCFPQPSGCTGTGDCSYIYTHRTNGSHITVELFATLGAGSGWAAVAYSTDSKMGNDDVLACDIGPGGIVTAKNLWNAGRSNRADAGGSTSFLTLLEASRTDNQIYCRFSRPLLTGATDDFDLSQPYTYFYGTRSNGIASATSGLSGQHNRNPVASTSAASASTTGVGSASGQNREAVKAHGILMVLAWTGASSVGMFLARFMRRAWVDKPYWFMAHRITMVCVWLVTCVSFILIFVDVGGYTNYESHGALGIITVGLAFIQPFMTLLRCHPGDEKRWIFTWAHRLVGLCAQIFALAAIYLGLDAYKELGFDIKEGGKTTWIVWVGVCGGLWIALELYTFIAKPETQSAPKAPAMEMKEKGGDDADAPPPPPELIADYRSRRIVFIIYLICSVSFAIALCVLIGVASNGFNSDDD